MSPQLKIAPSILAADFLRLEEQISLALEGGADYIHLDVMDGRFVRNITFGPAMVAAISPLVHRAGAQVDVHLMIESPEYFIPAFALAGADILTIHVETCKDLAGTLKGIRVHGARAGLTLRPKTPLLAITSVIPLADLILVMSVEPGQGGQNFLPESFARLKRIRELIEEAGTRADLEVDGGIQEENVRRIVEAGANVLVSGTAIFKSPLPIPDAVRALRQAAGFPSPTVP
jgi:ribulose-phosphate 3-epimerase